VFVHTTVDQALDRRSAAQTVDDTSRSAISYCELADANSTFDHHSQTDANSS